MQRPSRGLNCAQARTCASLAALGSRFRACKPVCPTGLHDVDAVTHPH
jgi:hypothetical protein